MSKPVAVSLAVVGWAGVAVAMNFHEIVPNASEQEIKPFLTAAWIFAIVTTLLVIKTFATKPTA